MNYFPLQDPITKVLIDRSPRFGIVTVAIWVNNSPGGYLELAHDEVDDFVKNVCAGHEPVCNIDFGLIVWHSDYDKKQVVDEDGSLVSVLELEKRDE